MQPIGGRSETTCLLCASEVGHIDYLIFPQGFNYDCPICGRVMAIAARIRQELDEISRAKISAFTRNRTFWGDPPMVLAQEPGPISLGGEQYMRITAQQAIGAFPKTFSERRERILLNLYHMGNPPYTIFDNPVPFQEIYIQNREIDYALFYGENPNVRDYLLESLGTNGLIKVISDCGCPVQACFTVRGYQYIDNMRDSKYNPTSNLIFLAIPFKLHEKVTDMMKISLSQAGYDARPVWGARANTKIDDRIIAEIRKARFVVADLTDGKPNVYFEAGFAKALGKEVVFTMDQKQLDENKAHFDIRQYPIIGWNLEELTPFSNELQAHVEATIGVYHAE